MDQQSGQSEQIGVKEIRRLKINVPKSMTTQQVIIKYGLKQGAAKNARKKGFFVKNLKELLGFGSYGTAWSWMQKLRRCTIRQDREKLCGRVEVDEFVIGGQKSGKRGRGAQGKTIVAVAVER